ncbi:hypothetical protein P8452_26699 [Trifolium repens]|nr:hypothetical protein P8452_26699 [Trifolium repens]
MEIEKETTGEGERRRSIGEELHNFIQAHHVARAFDQERCQSEIFELLTIDFKQGKEQKTNLPIDRPYDPVKSLTNKKENWRLGVFVEDKWSVYKGDTEVTMELLLQDIKMLLELLILLASV